jgi:phospholipase C
MWASTAIVVTYDDSDGWHDSILGPLLTQSATSLDALTETGQCGSSPNLVPMNTAHQPEQGRCGVGPRLPFLLISPWARARQRCGGCCGRLDRADVHLRQDARQWHAVHQPVNRGADEQAITERNGNDADD